MEAPSFDSARRSLYAQLSKWCFVRVFRPCTVPPDGRTVVDGKELITYYHGSAAKCAVSAVPGGSNKVWFKKSDTRAALDIGPLTVEGPGPDFMPRVGDVLMGKMVRADAKGGRDERKARSGEENDRLLFWYPNAAYLETLLSVVCNGTTLPEQQLAHDLKRRVPNSEDDAWAVARLILFGNVAAFADQHLGRASKPMRLSCPPLTFVWKCASDFDDMSIWTKFVELVPDATPPPQEEKEKAAAAPIVRPLSFLASDDFVGKPRKRHSEPPPPNYHSSYQPPYGLGRAPDAFNYQSGPPLGYQFPPPPAPTAGFKFDPPSQPASLHSPGREGAQSPVYSPNTPPGSPPFRVTPPGSPKYSPTTPPYAAELEYDPESPAYYPPAPPTISAESVLNLLRSVDNIKQQRGIP